MAQNSTRPTQRPYMYYYMYLSTYGYGTVLLRSDDSKQPIVYR